MKACELCVFDVRELTAHLGGIKILDKFVRATKIVLCKTTKINSCGYVLQPTVSERSLGERLL